MLSALRSLHAWIALAIVMSACGGGDALVGDLRDGGYVLVFRHTATETRIDEQESLRSCSRQRNLSADGRAQAREIGEAIRGLEIPIGDVRASPMCRTRDTAELAFGRVTTDRRLISPGVIGTVEDDDRRARQLRELVDTPPPEGTNTIIVTHTGTIGAALDESLDEGEMLAYEDGRLAGRVKPDEWASLR
jgi:broad specificity phosphatase PhoE